VFTDLRFTGRCQGLDDLVHGDSRGGGGGHFLVLQASARRPGDDPAGTAVDALAVGLLVQGGVPRLRLVLANNEPGQRQVLD